MPLTNAELRALEPKPPKGANHAFLTGELWGAMRRSGIDANPVIVDLEDGEGTGYSDSIDIERDSGIWRVKVFPLDVKEL